MQGDCLVLQVVLGNVGFSLTFGFCGSQIKRWLHFIKLKIKLFSTMHIIKVIGFTFIF